jgi:hypothetical protein
MMHQLLRVAFCLFSVFICVLGYLSAGLFYLKTKTFKLLFKSYPSSEHFCISYTKMIKFVKAETELFIRMKNSLQKHHFHIANKQ